MTASNPVTATIWILYAGDRRGRGGDWTPMEVYDFADRSTFPYGATLEDKVAVVEKRAAEYRRGSAEDGPSRGAVVRVMYWSKFPDDGVGEPPK